MFLPFTPSYEITEHGLESILSVIATMFETEEHLCRYAGWGWMVGSDCFFACTCTDGARYLQMIFGGRVVGCFRTKINYGGGHDWLVLGTLIVDYWATHVADPEHPSILDMANAQDSLRIVEFYGATKDWETPHFQH